MPFLVFVVLESSAHSNFLQKIWVNQFNLFNKSQTFSNSPILFKTLSERSCKLAALLLHHSGIFKSRKKMQQSLSYSFDIGTEVCITINLCLLISMRCDKKSRGYLLKNSCMLIYTRVPSEYVYHITSYLGKLLPSLLGSSANLQHGPLTQTKEY